MSAIEILAHHVVYENPKPHVHSRHGFFAGLNKLLNGDLLALFVRSEAFESPDATTFIARSTDRGVTWSTEGPLYNKSKLGIETSDYMKGTTLRNGMVVAIGYRFYRHDIESGIGIEETGGILPGENIVAFSSDKGHSWSAPRVVKRSYPELLEISGPCVELQSGDLIAAAGLLKLPDGSNPTGQRGVVLRSIDQGETWDDTNSFFKSHSKAITAYEPRLCEMQAGRLVGIFWAYDLDSQRHLTNQVVVSHDSGHTWSDPIETGLLGQASNLLWLGGDRLLTIHSHREKEFGIYVRLIDFNKDRWIKLDEKLIWGSTPGRQTGVKKDLISIFKSLKFGQPSLLQLDDHEVLATHWSIDGDGQGRIHAHRLSIKL